MDYLKKRGQRTQSLVAAASTPLPVDVSWNKAVSSCADLNNDSTLFYYTNNNEYEYLINLLTKLHFPSLLDENSMSLNKDIYNEEQKYFIGLTYNS